MTPDASRPATIGHNGAPPTAGFAADCYAIAIGMTRARVSAGLTQEALGGLLGLSGDSARNTVNAYEGGRREPSLKRACQMARALGCRLVLVNENVAPSEVRP